MARPPLGRAVSSRMGKFLLGEVRMSILSRRLFPRRARAAAVALATAFATVTAAAPPAAAATCATPAEEAALHVRSLQTWLVVSSLTCGSVDQYNGFVVKFRPALQRHGDALISYFHKAYGGAGTDKLNRYVTLLANQASALSLKDRDAFCARSAAMYQEMDAAVAVSALDSYSAEKVGLLAVEPRSCMPDTLVVSFN